MAKKSHLKIKNELQRESTTPFRYNYGYGDNDESEQHTKIENMALAQRLKSSVHNLQKDINEKYQQRDLSIEIPLHIDYIRINFVDQFDIETYNTKYYSDLGLESVQFSNFNKTGLFAIIDQEKFKKFYNGLEKFINTNSKIGTDADRPPYVGYINDFALLTSKDIISYNANHDNDILSLNIINLPADEDTKSEIINSLLYYLDKNSISYLFYEAIDKIEIQNPTDEEILKIVQNFDIILSVTSSFTRVKRPSEFNTVTTATAFRVSNKDESLPIVAIIDTGVSKYSPLGEILIPDDTFTLVGDPLLDNCDSNGEGHGTGVAGLAAFGKNNHINNFEGEVFADAKVLSMKILDDSSGTISEIELVRNLYLIKEKYPEIKIFVLTIGYEVHKRDNENYSEYTYLLDKFSHDTDSIIFISTTNNDECISDRNSYDQSYFGLEKTNLATPADSLNNVTVGACGDNLKGNSELLVSPTNDFPTVYSRTGHLDLISILSPQKRNRHLFKPDILESGGDHTLSSSGFFGQHPDNSITVIASDPSIGSYDNIGTSFSAPLAANVALRIQAAYPHLKSQTIKALLINSASNTTIPFDETNIHLKNRTVGYGVMSYVDSVFSNENAATFILEDSIQQEKMKIFPIKIPRYIVAERMGKKNQILKITATLCFSFLPIKNNQLSYCPIHIAFGFFKKHSAEQILAANRIIKSNFKSSLTWSQHARYKAKPAPFSNTQKISFVVNCQELIDQDYTIKLAVNCRLSKQIVGGIPNSYPKDFPFSIVFRIEETIKENTGLLYDELVAINEVEVLNEIDLEGEAEAE